MSRRADLVRQRAEFAAESIRVCELLARERGHRYGLGSPLTMRRLDRIPGCLDSHGSHGGVFVPRSSGIHRIARPKALGR